MTYLLDTCVISEAMSKKPSRKVLDWMGSIDENLLFISAITIGEIRHGIAALGKTKRARFLDGWLAELKSRFEGRIVSFTPAVAEVWGEMIAEVERQGNPRPVMDSLIAASALADNMTVVTRNAKDMAHMGVKVFNPWE